MPEALPWFTFRLSLVLMIPSSRAFFPTGGGNVVAREAGSPTYPTDKEGLCPGLSIKSGEHP